MLRGASIEVSAHDLSVVDKTRDEIPAGTEVYINFIPNGDYRSTAAVACGLAKAGFVAVPHLAARSVSSRAELEHFLTLIAADGVDRLLCIGADAKTPAGPYAETLDILKTGLLESHGIKRVGFAGHPEGHHVVSELALRQALHDKIAHARSVGLETNIVTQFFFEAAPVVEWLAGLKSDGIDVPIRLGVAGPASVATLVKYAMACGVGNSLRTLSRRPTSFGRLLTDNTPDDMLKDLIGQMQARGIAVPDLHIFPFGGLKKMERWRQAGIAGR